MDKSSTEPEKKKRKTTDERDSSTVDTGGPSTSMYVPRTTTATSDTSTSARLSVLTTSISRPSTSDSGPSTSGPIASGPSTSRRITSGPSASGPSTSGPSTSYPSTSPSAGGPSTSIPSTDSPTISLKSPSPTSSIDSSSSSPTSPGTSSSSSSTGSIGTISTRSPISTIASEDIRIKYPYEKMTSASKEKEKSTVNVQMNKFDNQLTTEQKSKFDANHTLQEKLEIIETFLKEDDKPVFLDRGRKSRTYAKNLLEDAEYKWTQEEYFEALYSMNKSVAFAPTGRRFIFQAYVARAKALYKSKEYIECQDSTFYARNLGNCPARRKRSLFRVEEICEKYSDDFLGWLVNKHNTINSLLSINDTERHNNVPFILNCLEFDVSNDYGRGIKTNRELKPGDVVATERGYAPILYSHEQQYHFCENCLRMRWALIPCPNCTRAMYCSEICLEEAAQEHHKYECKRMSYITNCFGDEHRNKFRAILQTILLTGGIYQLIDIVARPTDNRSIFEVNHTVESEEELISKARFMEEQGGKRKVEAKKWKEEDKKRREEAQMMQVEEDETMAEARQEEEAMEEEEAKKMEEDRRRKKRKLKKMLKTVIKNRDDVFKDEHFTKQRKDNYAAMFSLINGYREPNGYDQKHYFLAAVLTHLIYILLCDIFPDDFLTITEEQSTLLKEFIHRYCLAAKNLSVPLCTFSDDAAVTRFEYGSTIYPFSSLLNHSCSPNIIRVNNGARAVCVAIKPIEAGEQLFVSYGAYYTLENVQSRRGRLSEQYRFTCSCIACTEDYPLEAGLVKKCLPTRVINFTDPIVHDVATLVSRIQKYGQFLDSHHTFYPSMEITFAEDVLHKYLNHLLVHRVRKYAPS